MAMGVESAFHTFAAHSPQGRASDINVACYTVSARCTAASPFLSKLLTFRRTFLPSRATRDADSRLPLAVSSRENASVAEMSLPGD
jgi:hypothetical protein